MKRIIDHIPVEQVKAMVDSLLEAGLSPEQAAQEVAAFLDRTIDFRQVIRGVGGQIAESVDGPVFYALALAIAQLFVALHPRR